MIKSEISTEVKTGCDIYIGLGRTQGEIIMDRVFKTKSCSFSLTDINLPTLSTQIAIS